jgi:hypothetical protein
MWKTGQCKHITVNITSFANTLFLRSQSHTNANHDLINYHEMYQLHMYVQAFIKTCYEWHTLPGKRYGLRIKRKKLKN